MSWWSLFSSSSFALESQDQAIGASGIDDKDEHINVWDANNDRKLIVLSAIIVRGYSLPSFPLGGAGHLQGNWFGHGHVTSTPVG